MVQYDRQSAGTPRGASLLLWLDSVAYAVGFERNLVPEQDGSICTPVASREPPFCDRPRSISLLSSLIGYVLYEYVPSSVVLHSRLTTSPSSSLLPTLLQLVVGRHRIVKGGSGNCAEGRGEVCRKA